MPFKKKLLDKKIIKHAKNYLNVLFEIKEKNVDVWKSPEIGYIIKSVVILRLAHEVTDEQAKAIVNFLGYPNKSPERYI